MAEGGGKKMPRSFTLSEYESDVRGVVACAENSGRAVVTDDDGRTTQFVINIPQQNLPGFSDTDE